MERLTERHCGIAVIKDKNRDKEAMQRLAEYEDLGVTPEQLRQIDALYSQLAKELADERKKREWIPTEGKTGRLPTKEEFIANYIREIYAAEFIVMIEGATRPTTLFYRNGSWFDEERYHYKVIAWMPLPEPFVNEC